MADKLSAALPAQLPAYWTKALSMTGGPMVERNLRTAIAFFLHYYRDIDIRKKLPSLFKGIDWHQPVQVARLQKGATVAAFRRVEMATNLSQPMFFNTSTKSVTRADRA